MSELAKLVVASLFALNQYLPVSTEENQPKRLISDIRSLSNQQIEALVFPAAHHSCRFMAEVFWLEVTGSSSRSSPEFLAAMKTFAGDNSFENLMTQGKGTKYEQRALAAGVNIKEAQNVFLKICSEHFYPNSFSLAEAREVREFINTKVKVLDDKVMGSLGSFRFFGSAEMFDRDSHYLATIETKGKQWIAFRDIPRKVIHALWATEDLGFVAHEGIEPKGLARIAAQMAFGKSHIAGGSTLTMQLLKNLYFNDWPEPRGSKFQNSDLKKVLRKAREIYWAKPYEQFHGGGRKGKEYVLEQYLNLVSFGPNIQGIVQAAQVYFGKEVGDLTTGEAAYIISLLKNPSVYSNPRYFSRTTSRVQDYILPQMLDNGMITTEEEFVDAMDNHLPAQDWQGPISETISDAFIYVRNQARSWIRRTQIFFGGKRPVEVKVQTTINKDLQQAVFDATRKVLNQHDAVKARNSISRVDVAYDSTGRVASSEVSDLYSSTLKALKELQVSVNLFEDGLYMLSVFIGQTYDKKDQKFQRHYLNLSPSYKDYPPQVKKKIFQVLSKNSNRIGEISVLNVSSVNCPFEEDYVEKMGKLDPDDIKYPAQFLEVKESFIPQDPSCVEVEKNLPFQDQNVQKSFDSLRKQVKSQLIGSALSRIGSGRSRMAYYPAMFDGYESGNQTLVFEDGSRPTLTKTHTEHLQKLKERKNGMKLGNVVWVAVLESSRKPSKAKKCNEEKKDADCSEGETSDRKIAEQAKFFKLVAPKLQAAVLIIDSHSGEILANFGGYEPSISAFDRSRLALRQPGSTVKPWIYFYALSKGFDAHQIIQNSGVSFRVGRGEPDWKPGGSVIAAEIPFYQGLVHSQNQATVGLVKNKSWNGGKWRTNLREICNFFESIKLYDQSGCYPSFLLGTQEVSIVDLVQSYTYFSNGNAIKKPHLIKKVSDGVGNQFYQDEAEGVIAVNESTAERLFQIRSMLVQVNNYGTGKNLNDFLYNFAGKNHEFPFREKCYVGFGGPGVQSCFGGKTGTTNSAKDTWYVGFSNKYVIGVWVGYDFPEAIASDSSGASVAYPIFREILATSYDLLPEIDPLLTSVSVPEGHRAVQEQRAADGKTCVAGDSVQGSTTIFTNKSAEALSPCNRCRCRKEFYGSNDDGYYFERYKYNSGTKSWGWKTLESFRRKNSARDQASCNTWLESYTRSGWCGDRQ